jgi:hypothetical protein
MFKQEVSISKGRRVEKNIKKRAKASARSAGALIVFAQDSLTTVWKFFAFLVVDDNEKHDFSMSHLLVSFQVLMITSLSFSMSGKSALIVL